MLGYMSDFTLIQALRLLKAQGSLELGRTRELVMLQQMWEVLLEANKPSKGVSYHSFERFLLAIEGLLPRKKEEDCSTLFAEFKPLYHNRLQNHARLNRSKERAHAQEVFCTFKPVLISPVRTQRDD